MKTGNPLDYILTRRSTRKFLPDPLPRDLLERVLAAGRSAPSGGNNRTTHLIVVEDAGTRETLQAAAREAFAAMKLAPDTYKSLAMAIRLSKRGTYVYDYHAPVLVILANRKEYGNNMADSVCVAENMLIAANMLDLAACYINQLYWLTEHPRMRPLLTKLGLREEENVYATVLLGRPATADGQPVRTPAPDRGNPVTFAPPLV